MDYAEILHKMHYDALAKCFDSGAFYKIDKSVASNNIKVDWHAICADVNSGYLLYSIENPDGGSSLINAFLNMKLKNSLNAPINGSGSGYFFFDQTENRLYFLKCFDDVSQLLPGKITIHADTIRSSSVKRVQSPLPLNIQSIPFDMPSDDGSCFAVSVNKLNYTEQCMEYTFTRSLQRTNADSSEAVSSGIVHLPWKGSPPELYVSTCNDRDDGKYMQLCSIISSKQGQDESIYHCKFEPDITTPVNADNLYFVYNSIASVQINGNFGIDFIYEPCYESLKFHRYKINKAFSNCGFNFLVKEIIAGSICTRVLLDTVNLKLPNDLRSVIKLKNSNKELMMYGAVMNNGSFTVDFITEDMYEPLSLEIDGDIVKISAD